MSSYLEDFDLFLQTGQGLIVFLRLRGLLSATELLSLEAAGDFETPRNHLHTIFVHLRQSGAVDRHFAGVTGARPRGSAELIVLSFGHVGGSGS